MDNEKQQLVRMHPTPPSSLSSAHPRALLRCPIECPPGVYGGQCRAEPREVGAILQNELFKRVNDHLDSEDMTDEHRTAVRDMVIDALTETLHED